MALTPVQQLQAELDSLLEDYLEALDQYQQGVARLSEHLKAGHMNLARAKVALGPGRVGPAKYDLTERASNKIVEVTPLSGSDAPTRADPAAAASWTYALVDRPFEPDLASMSDKSESSEGYPAGRFEATGAASLRRRRLPDSPADAPAPPTRAEAPPATLPRPSPLAQFSALPPPALRASATSFGRAAGVAVGIVDAAARVRDCARQVKRARRELERRERNHEGGPGSPAPVS